MKTKLLALAVAAAIAPAASYAVNDAAITFTGEIYQPTCEVIAGDKAKTVDLKKHLSSYFTAANVETEKVPFSIKLEKCPAASTGAKIQVAPAVGTKADLPISATYGDAVIALYTANGSSDVALKLNDSTTFPVLESAPNLEFKYKAAIKSTKANPAAQEISTVLNFDIVYK